MASDRTKTGGVALAAHRDSHFRPLKDIEIDGPVRLRTQQGLFSYKVEEILRTTPHDVAVLGDRGGSSLTLITSYPFRYIGTGPERLVVRGRLVSAVQRDR